MSQRNKMSLVLLNLDQKGHQAFQKMTSHSSLRIDSQRNKNKTAYYENIQYQNNHMKYPFGLTEERFKWQNLDNKNQPINVLETRKQRKFVPKPNCLDGGFEDFFSAEQHRSNRVQSSKKRVSSETYGIRGSRRVLQPEYDYDKKDYEVKLGKKYFQKANITFKRPPVAPVGSMTSLMNKTPTSFPVKGKKKVASASFDKDAINLFSEDYHNHISPVRPSKKMFLF